MIYLQIGNNIKAGKSNWNARLSELQESWRDRWEIRSLKQNTFRLNILFGS
jgi:hypothetical protein